jgi:hypothetical protein
LWTGVLIFVLILLLILACVKWRYVVVADSGSFQFVLGGGAGMLSHWDATYCSFGRGDSVICFVRFDSWQQFETEWAQAGFWPIRNVNRIVSAISVPLWMPLALVGVPTFWLWRRNRRRPAPGACRCGYDLTGNTSGRCPECGQPRLAPG